MFLLQWHDFFGNSLISIYMKRLILFFLLLFYAGCASSSDRAKSAYDTHIKNINGMLAEKGIKGNTSFNVFLRVIKEEELIEVWVNSGGKKYELLKKYEVCRMSGELGPKRKKGDYQTPEGFYYIDRFNPNSSYHLSLGLNYPNTSDTYFAGNDDPGGDIFIHGKCVTIGCLPITDTKIEELYVLCSEAKKRGQSKIRVHVFPARLSKENLSRLLKEKGSANEIFWKNLQEGYLYFETKKVLPQVSVGNKGKYIFK